MLTQPLITNYLNANSPARTNGHTLERNRPDPSRSLLINHIIIGGAEQHFTAKLQGGLDGPLVGGCFGTLELYEDNAGGMWINHIEVAENAQRCKIASKLCMKAITAHGHLYASNSHVDPGGNHDTRHLSEEGAALVRDLINRGIMAQDWLRPPAI
jgi:hypothetical protein